MLNLLRQLIQQIKDKDHAAREDAKSRQQILDWVGLNSFEHLPDTPWKIESNISPLFWTESDQDIFAYHEGSKSRCSLRLGNIPDNFQTVLIAFDLEANQLLIDFPFPAAPHQTFDRQTHYKLMLESPDGRLTLSLRYEGEIRTPYGNAMLMNVLEKTNHSDRRLDMRVSFDRCNAPKINLLLPMKSHIHGHLLNLSENGLCLSVYGPKDVSLYRRKGECSIYFDEHFTLKCKLNIKDGRFTRQPCAQTHLRATFCDMAVADRDKLRAFITSLGQQAWPLFAA